MKLLFLLTTILPFLPSTVSQNTTTTIAHFVPENTFNLPRPFLSSFNTSFIDTSVPNASALNFTFITSKSYPFTAFSPSFDNLLGKNRTIRTIAKSSNGFDFAFESGIWVAPSRQIWFTSFLDTDMPGALSILDLESGETQRPSLTGKAASYFLNPNGGYYNSKDGLVWMTTFGSGDISPGIFTIDPKTFEVLERINSYFGLPLNGPDDLVWSHGGGNGEGEGNQSCLFFTDFLFSSEAVPGAWSGSQQLPYHVWSYTPPSPTGEEDAFLKPVIGPKDVEVPNGIAVDKDAKYLYITDGPKSSVFEEPLKTGTTTFPGVYRYSLGDDCTLHTKTLFALPRRGFANGIKVDDKGRVWTAEYEGIVARDGRGSVLGIINQEEILKGVDVPGVAPVANFALAGDKVYWLAFDRIIEIGLGEWVISPR